MNILIWIVFGAVVGWLSSIIMKANQSQSVGSDIVLGVLGAVVGGFVMNLFGNSGVTGFNVYSFVVALMGASSLIWVGKRFV